MQDYSEGTGNLALKKITPVISALFRSFDVEKSGEGSAYIHWSRGDDHAPMGLWNQVVDDLEALAKDLGLTDGTDGNDVPWVFGALLDHFRVEAGTRDEVLRAMPNAEQIEDGGEVEFRDLLTLARAFDDGHGLESVEFDCASWADRPRAGEFYGTGIFESAAFSLWMNTSDELNWAGKLSGAITSKKHDQATDLLASKVKGLLNSITDPAVRTALTTDLITALQATAS